MWAGTERYQVVRELGSGGFGAVYEAMDRRYDRRVAIKTLTRDAAWDVFEFKREFRRFAELRHPNIIRLHELGKSDDTYFFTMELVAGAIDWLSWVRAGHPVCETAPACDLRRLRATLAQLWSAIEALHAAGFAHCDLKPGNVLVTPAGQVKLLDFGLAAGSVAEAQTETMDSVRGTPIYMAPEQAAPGGRTPAADWYALGVMLHEALEGAPPFRGTIMQVLAQKVAGAYVPLRAAQAPEDLRSLVEGLLDTNPERRLGSVREYPRPESVGWESQAVESVRSVSPEAPTLDVIAVAPAASTQPRGESATCEIGAMPTPARVEPLAPAAGDEVFVGRTTELGELKAALDESRTRPLRIDLFGESGMGKSALLRRFIRDAEANGAWIFAGRSNQRESMPFKALDPIVDALGRHLATLADGIAGALLPRNILAAAELFPSFARVPAVAAMPAPRGVTMTSGEAQAAAARALGELVAAMADRHPVALVFDDAQWGDVESTSLLRMMFSGDAPPHALVLVVARVEERETSAMLNEIAERWDTIAHRSIELRGLSEHESAEMVRRWLERDASAEEARGPSRSDLVRTLASAAGGSPFFAEQLSRIQRELAGASSCPPRLETLVARRIHGLAPSDAEVLSCLAVAGRGMPISLLARAVSNSVDETLNSVAQLVEAGLVRRVGEEGEHAEIFHDRIRVGAVDLLSPSAQRERHQALATALLADTKPADERAEALYAHLRASGNEPAAIEWGIRAAHIARERGALDRAAVLFRELITLADGTGGSSTALWSELAEVLSDDERAGEAVRALEAAEGSVTSADEKDQLRARRGLEMVVAGQIDEGLALIRPIVRSWGVWLPRSAWMLPIAMLMRAPALMWCHVRARARTHEGPALHAWLPVFVGRLSAAMMTHDLLAGSQIGVERALSAFRHGRSGDLALAPLSLPFYALIYANWREPYERARGAFEQRREEFTPFASRYFALMDAAAYAMQADWPRASERLGHVPRIGASSFRDGFLGRCATFLRLYAMLLQGDYLQLGQSATSLREWAANRGDSDTMSLAEVFQGLASIPRGVFRPRAQSASTDTPYRASARLIASALACDSHEALEAHLAAHRYAMKSQPSLRWAPQFRAHLDSHRCLAEVSTSRVEVPASTLRWLRRTARRHRFPGVQGIAHALLAGISYERGDSESARVGLRRAIPLLARSGRMQFLAAARLHLALMTEQDPDAPALRHAALQYMAEQDVADPEAFALRHLPGFASAHSRGLVTPRTERE